MGKNGNGYENWDKKDLIAEIKSLKQRKKFGLVWENKPEEVVDRCGKELPVLEEVKSLALNGADDAPTNLLIEGDNYHSLAVLNYTHRGKIDVIYIDPPYNTGARDWKYNNDYVDANDGYRHSKWLSMMSHRLALAKNLLSPSGIICIAIDHNELFNLGCLCDEIFNEQNRLGVISIRHHPRGRTQSHFFSTVHEHVLFYGKNRDKITKDFRFGENQNEETVSLVRSREDSTPETRPNLFYPIFYNPETKEITLQNKGDGFVKILPASQNGARTWQLVKESFLEELGDGNISVKKNGDGYKVFRTVVRKKHKATTMWTDACYDANHHGYVLVKKLFDGKKMFDFPKSVYAVLDTLLLTSNKNSVILDFFAGSGTTGHAVSLLNKEDGGNRKFILCTNNENGIAREVCYPRIKAVIKGHKNLPDITSIPSNLRYFKTTFVAAAPTDPNKLRLTEKAADMICVKEGTFAPVKETKAYKIFRDGGRYTAIVYDYKAIPQIKKFAAQTDGKFAAYIFSLADDDFADEFADMRDKIQTRAIPEAILRVYRQILGK